jgi:hypothetical protein
LVVKRAKWSPFAKPVIAYALIPFLADETPKNQLSTKTLGRILMDYFGYIPSQSYISKLKKIALQIMYDVGSTATNRLSKPMNPRNNSMLRVVQFIEVLRGDGHFVSVTTQSGDDLRKTILGTAKAEHTRLMKPRKAAHRSKFDVDSVKQSKFYQSVEPTDTFLHSFLFAPSTSIAQFDTLRKVSFSDMAHVYSVIGGVIYVRLALDVDHKMVVLVVGYFADNETKNCHTLANKFTCEAYHGYDQPSQVDITDGHKGGRAAADAVFQHVFAFLCNNHTSKNMLAAAACSSSPAVKLNRYVG